MEFVFFTATRIFHMSYWVHSLSLKCSSVSTCKNLPYIVFVMFHSASDERTSVRSTYQLCYVMSIVCHSKARGLIRTEECQKYM